MGESHVLQSNSEQSLETPHGGGESSEGRSSIYPDDIDRDLERLERIMRKFDDHLTRFQPGRHA